LPGGVDCDRRIWRCFRGGAEDCSGDSAFVWKSTLGLSLRVEKYQLVLLWETLDLIIIFVVAGFDDLMCKEEGDVHVLLCPVSIDTLILYQHN
jgi:hypothetical protein